MAILDQSYQPWSGETLPRHRRVSAMVRIGVRQAFSGTATKLTLLATYALMFGWMGLLFIFASARIPIPLAFGNEMYRHYLGDLFPMGILVMTLTALVGSRAISRDLRNNAMAMYFSKAITRLDYVLAKWATVSIFLLSATLAPTLMLWIGHWAMGRETLTAGQRFADLAGLTAQSFVIVLPTSAYILALSSISRTAYVPGILWVLTYLGSATVRGILQATVQEPWCALVDWHNLTARLGELCYELRSVDLPSVGERIAPTEPTMVYEAAVPGSILGIITVLSLATVLWRLRHFEGHE